MGEQELANKILDYIKTTYNAIYEGLLIVTKSNEVYTMKIGLPSYMMPTTLTLSTNSDDEFLEFIYEELRTRNYMRLEIYKVYRENDSREE